MEKEAFRIRLADMIIEIRHMYPFTKHICRDYIVAAASEEAVFAVEATQSDIEMEQKGSDFSAAYCESVCIYRNLVKKLPRYGAFFLHASVVEVDGFSYAFTAKSGTGKSTHTSLWLSHFGERARIINGDKPILRFKDDKLFVYGTPWCGKEGYNINTSSQLKALCFLERGCQNSIRRMGDSEIVSRIFHQVIMPDNIQEADAFFALIDRVVKEIPGYLLECTISDEAVVTAYDEMSK